MDHTETQRETFTGTRETRESEAALMGGSLAETKEGPAGGSVMKAIDRSRPNQGAESETLGLCIECAVRHHDLSQATRPHAGGSDRLEASLIDAWIDGRWYTMLSSVGATTMHCRECRRIMASIYLPTE